LTSKFGVASSFFFLLSSIPSSHFPQQHSSRLHDDSVIVCTNSVIPVAIAIITAEIAANICVVVLCIAVGYFLAATVHHHILVQQYVRGQHHVATAAVTAGFPLAVLPLWLLDHASWRWWLRWQVLLLEHRSVFAMVPRY
jgi:multisubunit Na+/H+ antiporter MnhG subunit